MSTRRYLELIKNSSEEDLKLYIYIIKLELENKRDEVIDLSNRNKSSLQLILKELIRDKLDIEYKYLEGDDLTEYENEDLDDFISSLFSRAQQIRGDISKQIEWLSEPRPLYFFSVLMRAVINNNITDLSYPVTLVDFKTTKIDFKTAKSTKDADEYKPGRFAQIFLDSVNKTHFLASLKSICPNKTSSAQDSIARTLEYIAVSCDVDDQRVMLEIINDIESLYQLSCRYVNTEWNVFNSNDEKLNAWYYHYLMKKYPGTGLNTTNDSIKQKHTIMCIFDVLCATTSPDDLSEKSSEATTFKKVVKELTDSFSRKAKSSSSQSNAFKTKEEKTLTFSEVDWAKLIELTGSDGRNEIKAKLKKLIDRELENRKNAKEGNVGQDSNDDSLTMPSEQKKKVTNLDKIFETKTFGRPLLKRD
ncbi:hypothetical protein FXE82_11630 [Vibrio cholerae]|uniref:hypothetical protein n=1 Tax=Vibrio cholerae TaxID=666 RepID=UPI0011DB65D8|nr:hypothetical protein [Vibrio cholerae]EKF9440675.1 hypothetical protein [Vibrio cholerae]MCR9970544.1 hypothetical protein [Vibrio cholerae]TXY38156.1 hypothetical protein FXE82_11630 [Vibrio cholerae]HDI3315604.1 hypothetical protein [Vibrio cholerae]HDL9478263.1 hypothetical protein [Vibrio cholerae]